MIKFKLTKYFVAVSCLFFIGACDNYYKNDYTDNSPTSGLLKVYHSEGLSLHIRNQAYTFSALYPNVKITCEEVSESEAVDALLKDSCKAIVINRLLGVSEQNAFANKQLNPRYSPLAKTGVALITNIKTPFKTLSMQQVNQLLTGELILTDSLNNKFKLRSVIDNKNSAVSHYLLDSIVTNHQFGANIFALNNSLDLIEEISKTPNSIGFIDFAWLSDSDDGLFKKYQDKIKFISIGRTDTIFFEPNQSSFKTGEYPLTRTIYLLRRSDDFSLAKGFEAFMAGPKGQLTFLKQGLLPIRQAERTIHVNMEPRGQ
jgi:phosphate transport system substrate-binding protein